jgi:hypothetical protein
LRELMLETSQGAGATRSLSFDPNKGKISRAKRVVNSHLDIIETVDCTQAAPYREGTGQLT